MKITEKGDKIMIIGAQLYTVREQCKTPEALAETLARVA